MSPTIARSALFLLSSFTILACTRAPTTHSELAQQFAERLCPIQDSCDCDPAVLIPSCEQEVIGELTTNERRALDAGLMLDEACLEAFLSGFESLDSCEPNRQRSTADCPVYYGTADVGDPCIVYEVYPWMTDCRQGLECRLGACRDLVNPLPLELGDLCSASQSVVSTGFLGECISGLRCDSYGTQTCVVDDLPPPVSLGGECTFTRPCEQGLLCRPPEGAMDVSEDAPGTCTAFGSAGDPCTLVYECDWICEDGRCQPVPPALCGILEDWVSAREFIPLQP